LQDFAKKRCLALIKCPEKRSKIAQNTALRPVKRAIPMQKRGHFLRKMDKYCIFWALINPPKGRKKEAFLGK
jgi:hypothetical protein